MKVKQRSADGVREIVGEQYRFFVPSDRLGVDDYLIDLEAHNGDGQCDCPRWQIKCRTARRDGETDPKLIECKHIARAREHWARKELREQIRAKHVAQKGRVEE